MNARDIFQNALFLQPGEKMEIQCEDESETLSIRTQLFRQKKIVAESMEQLVADLRIRFSVKECKVFIIREDNKPNITIIKKDGTKEPLKEDEDKCEI